MNDLRHKFGILFGVLLLILPVSYRFQWSALEKHLSPILKSLATTDWENDYNDNSSLLDEKCLMDNHLTVAEVISDLLSFPYKTINKCSMLCLFVKLGVVDENGKLLPENRERIAAGCPEDETVEDKCEAAYKLALCLGDTAKVL